MIKEGKPQRTFIEHFLPVKEISTEAKKEKSGRPPTFSMHYWWTRKPLIAARAAVLGTLLPTDFDRMEFKELLGLGREKRAYNYGVDLNGLRMRYKDMWGTESPKVLDPFGGGGSIPFEAMRLGVNVYCADYNPVAYIILKTALEYPQKYGEQLIKDVKFWTDWILKKTKNELNELYPEHDGKKVAAYIYAWVVTCPFCGLKIPLVTNWWLVKKGEKQVYLNPVVKNGSITFTIEKKGTPQKGTVLRGKGRCLQCGHTIVNTYIQKEITEKREEKLLAVVLLGSNGKGYDLPTDTDISALEKAKTLLNEQISVLKNEGLLPDGHPDPGEVTSARYLPAWLDHFNERQLLLITTLIKNIRLALQLIHKDPEYISTIAAALYHIVGKHVDYNCRTTRWHTGYEKIGDVMSFRRPSLTWDHAEVNPFVKSSGTLLSAKKCVIEGLTYAVDKLAHAQPPIVLCKSVLEDFSMYLRVEKGISEGIARSYGYSVRKFLRWADTLNPEKKYAVKYYDRLLKEKKKASTIANILFALKHYYQFAGKELHLKPPKRTVKQIDYLTVIESKSLLYKIDNFRDYAMVLMMLYGGLRVSEVCNLDRDDVDTEEFTITVRNTKNKVDRTVMVTEKCIMDVEKYLETRIDTEKPLFVSRKGRRISRTQILRLVKKYALLAGLRTYKDNV